MLSGWSVRKILIREKVRKRSDIVLAALIIQFKSVNLDLLSSVRSPILSILG